MKWLPSIFGKKVEAGNSMPPRRGGGGSLVSDFDRLRADYAMSRESRFIRRRTGLAPAGSGADYHYRNEADYYRDIEKSRDLDRNDSVIGQITTRAVDNIVQDGFSLDPQTGDKFLDDELWSRWQDWANDAQQCDIAGEAVFHDFERQSMRGEIRDGDCVVTGIQGGRLQMLEAHTIQTLTKGGFNDGIILGVEKGSNGERKRYHVVEEDGNYGRLIQGDPLDVYDSEGVRQLFHVYDTRRMSMTRGVTAYAPCFEVAGMFEDINFAKLVQQQVVSCFAIFRKKSPIPGANLPHKGGAQYGNGTTEVTGSGETRIIDNIGPGMEISGAPGEELQGFSPNTPNAEYFEHVKLMLTIIGVNLGLPLCLVLMDGSETNFSGWRGAVDEARKGFKQKQKNLVNRLHSPLYRWKVHQWMQEDAAMRSVAKMSGINIFGHKWNTPRWGYIDPVGDAQGDQLRLEITQTSRRRLHAEHGDEWEEIADEQIADNAYAIERALARAAAINMQYQDAGIKWYHLISLPVTSGVPIASPDQATDQPGQQAQAAGTGEMSTLNRRQFTNNQKAITDLLTAMIKGEMSEARVRVGLSTLGLTADNIESLVVDARDGSIDTV